MAHFNYLKCLNGVPFQPLEWTLDPSALPTETGITWEPFDTDLIRPVDIKDTLVDGKVALDQGRKDDYDLAITKGQNRKAAVAAARVSGAAQANPASWSVAERKIAFGLIPTDAELGI